jgi:SAM-dependent methyltransferase
MSESTPFYKSHPILKSMYKAQKKMRRVIWDSIESIYYRRNVKKAYGSLQNKLRNRDQDYDKYLRDQLEETLLKRKLRGTLSFDIIPLIDMLASKYDFEGQSVLCVGARNNDEIRYFRKLGAGYIVGIDLYEVPPDIVVMDMHDLKFEDNKFDVVYSRHSFEHAYDKHKAAAEFIRVVKQGGVIVVEVPGQYKGGGDYNYFHGTNSVIEAFGDHIDQYLWNEYSPKEENTHKMDIIRVMFLVKK